MKKYIAYILLACFGFGAVACESWLDVKPKTNTEEEDLFSREEGFKEALTGAYIKAAEMNLYGRNMSYGFIDILGQRYRYFTYGSDEGVFQNPAYYEFSNTNELTYKTTNTIWANMYTVIANLNNLLYWVDENKSVLSTPGYYGIIKGEALALRSYLYFDLLRLWGPVYKENPTGKSIPYRTKFARDSKVLVPANEMLDNIIRDLKEAEELLTGNDPLDFDKAMKTTWDHDGFLSYRFKRMNLMAVKALLARTYLYRGSAADKVQALDYAYEVVNSGHFSLTRSNNNDHIMSSELIFSFHINKMKENIIDRLTANYEYVINGNDFFNEQFNVAEDGLNDWRVKDQTGFITVNNVYVMRKFVQDGLQYGAAETMPMIRLAEMYLILAECETDLAKAENHLNQLRSARAADLVDKLQNEEDRMKWIEREYRKEFYGEGQLWYFYKRNYYRQFLHCPLATMHESNYTFAIPDDEYMYGIRE